MGDGAYHHLAEHRNLFLLFGAFARYHPHRQTQTLWKGGPSQMGDCRVQLVASAKTDVGRVRKNNEDAFVCEPSLGLFAVADGMGGHAAGEVAAQRAVDELRAAVTQHSALLSETASPEHRRRVLQFLKQTVVSTSAKIHEQAQGDAALRGMGCTLSVALVSGRGLFLAHVGDSRIYGFLGGVLYPLTEDHTFEQTLRQSGLLNEQDIQAHPGKNRLMRAIGVYPSVEVDTAYFDLAAGDVFLLCSDGVHGLVGQQAIVDALRKQTEFAVNSLISDALAAGGRDNATAIVLRVGDCGVPQPIRVGSAEIREAMMQADLFAKFSYNELLRVQQIAIGQVVTPGQAVFSAGELVEELFLVLDGMLSVYDGDKRVGWIGPGDPFGALSFVPSPSATHVRADVATRMLIFPVAELVELMGADPQLGLKLSQNALSRLWKRLGQLVEKNRRLSQELETKNSTT